MKQRKLISLLFIALLVTAGCQPTPQTEYVVSKIERLQTDNPVSSDMSVHPPANVEETYEQETLTIKFSAQVDYVEAESYPIPKIQSALFTQEDVSIIIDSLFGSHPLTSLIKPMTKAEYEEYYIQLQKELEDRKSHPENYGGDPNIEAVESELARIAAKILDAPDEVTTRVNPEELYETSFGYALNSSADLGMDDPAVLRITINEDDSDCYVYYQNGPRYSDVTMTFPELLHLEPKDIVISKEEALSLAEKTVHSLGANDLFANGYAVGVVSMNGLEDDMDDYKQQCHMFFFTRNVESTPVTYTEFNNPAISDQGFNYLPTFEYMIVCVDDTGVANIDWRGNCMITGYEAQDSQLLPFDNIMEIAKQQLINKFAWNEEDKPTSVLVTRITLGYATLLQKNDNSYNIMVPVWDFFGAVSHDGSFPLSSEVGFDSLLTINAIDGTIIDRNLGY